jgi:opacity protein-like surface antigen
MIPVGKTFHLVLCAAVLAVLSFVSPRADSASHKIKVSQELNAEFGYVVGSTIRGGGARLNSVDEQNAHLKYILSPQVTKNLLLRFGVEWQRLSFGVPDRAPVPDVLQQVSAIIGFDHPLGDRWIMRAEIQPGIYSDFQDVSARDVNAPLLAGAVFVVNADLQWFLGLRVNVRSQFPILPAVGVRWRFADEWTLNLVMPKPRLEYDVNERLKANFGFGIEAGTFKVGDHFGDDCGRPNLNHATVDYLEVRVGPGFSWKIKPNVTVEADAGYLVYRQFNFFDQDITFRSDSAPYIQLGCRVRF